LYAGAARRYGGCRRRAGAEYGGRAAGAPRSRVGGLGRGGGGRGAAGWWRGGFGGAPGPEGGGGPPTAARGARGRGLSSRRGIIFPTGGGQHSPSSSTRRRCQGGSAFTSPSISAAACGLVLMWSGWTVTTTTSIPDGP